MKKKKWIAVSLIFMLGVGVFFFVRMLRSPAAINTTHSEHTLSGERMPETAVVSTDIVTEDMTTSAENAVQIEGTTIENVFTYRNCVNPEVAEQDGFDESMLIYEVPAESAEYVAQLQIYCREHNLQQTENGLRFTCERVLAVDGLFALQWTVENISDEERILNAGWLTVNDEVGGGRGDVPNETHLCSGEILRFTTATVLPNFDKAQGALQMNITISDKDGKEIGDTVLELMADCSFTPMMGMPDGETLEIPWRNGILRVTEAKQNLGMGIYTILLIFDSKEQAMANDPCGDEASWYPGLFCDSALTDDSWITVGGGDIPDTPIELPDGRWAFSFNRTVDFMNWIPETVYVSPCPNWGEADRTAIIKIELGSDK